MLIRPHPSGGPSRGESMQFLRTSITVLAIASLVYGLGAAPVSATDSSVNKKIEQSAAAILVGFVDGIALEGRGSVFTTNSAELQSTLASIGVQSANTIFSVQKGSAPVTVSMLR